jgi:hypothetical protein
MSFKTFCDICNKEIIDYEDKFSTRSYDLESRTFCKKCWADKKNWSKIHKINKD